MKKLFIGLLIVAAGAPICFLLLKKDKSLTATNFQQEKIIGQWKLNSILLLNHANDNFLPRSMGMTDSWLRKYLFEFTKDGSIAFSLGDSLVKDSATYKWNSGKELIWQKYSTDSSGDVFKVSLLNNDSLVLLSKDSSLLLFTKAK